MLFPEAAKQAVVKTFFDKTIEILSKEETVDDEGGIVKTGMAVVESFQGNVRFVALESLQEEMGLAERIDVAITCATDTAVAVDDLLQYQGKQFVVTEVLPRDSHTLVAGRKWR